jgi:hypothetical protein
VIDHENEFRHLFVDRVTGEEWHFELVGEKDPKIAWLRGGS